MPAFDIIVPCYNYGRFLENCVESVLTQQVDLRLLIIDDCSNDETRDIAEAMSRKDSRVSFCRHPANEGHIATYNEGLDWARGDFFVILSADDMLMPGALSRASEALAARPNAALAYGSALYFPDGSLGDCPAEAFASGSVLVSPWPHNADDGLVEPRPGAIPLRVAESERKHEPTVYGTVEFFLLNRFINRPHMCSVVTPTAVQKRVGGYRPELPHAGDLEMWLRLAAHGPVVRIHAFQVAARMHGRNMSTQVYTRISRDFIERALVLDVIESSCGGRLPPGLMETMRCSLAKSAARAASGLSAAGSDPECDAILALARRLYPGFDWTLLGALLALKRHLGPGPWSSLALHIRPIAQRLLRLT
jgi:GT2 family glycosyltransferase